MTRTRAWGYVWRATVADWRDDRWGWCAGILAVASALVLPVALYVAALMLAPVARGWITDPELSVFMQLGASAAQIKSTQAGIEQRIAAERAAAPQAQLTVVTISKEQAFAQLRAQADRTGGAAAFDALKENPLPDGFIVRAARLAPERLAVLAQELGALPGVDQVQFDTAWAQRLARLAMAARTLGIVLATIFGFVVVAVTYNATRAQVLRQADEIEIARLVGATDAFVRRPFVARGALLGALGALLSILLVASGVWALTATDAGFVGLNAPSLADHVAEALVLISGVALLGAGGGGWSAQRQLASLR
ncbi:MAG TPA: permease-like cell division protein FtsX [Burkholderiaceae bacterium]|nr:permease-like cell division protein FtsX [Burkholderiaceae bacterium]